MPRRPVISTVLLLLLATTPESTGFLEQPCFPASIKTTKARHTAAFVIPSYRIQRAHEASTKDSTLFSVSRPVKNQMSSSSSSSSRSTRTTTLYGFFGGLFGSDSPTTKRENELARFENLGTAAAAANVKFDSLSTFLIHEWSSMFVVAADSSTAEKPQIALTTPVKRVLFEEGSSKLPESLDPEAKKWAAVQLIFHPKFGSGSSASYKSSKEEKQSGDGGGDNQEKKKKTAAKEGGVEIIVEQLADNQLRVRASRCEFDEDTTFKEMSEESIVNRLKEALQAWKKL